MATVSQPTAPPQLRGVMEPLHGGPLALVRFLRAHGMLNLKYARLAARWAWLKLRFRGRLQTDGLCFVGPNVRLEIKPGARLKLGRWSWIGHGTKIRVHEGTVEIGAKTVLGQECTISAFQHISIGCECIVADRVMLIDFDHGVVEVERPIRLQGIYKRDVNVGANTVVTKDVPSNAVVAGAPARLLRMREEPRTLRWR
jgi:acetyltransferase-like isoleucine patch superfamily enzyme